jgi:hypothetical protein
MLLVGLCSVLFGLFTLTWRLAVFGAIVGVVFLGINYGIAVLEREHIRRQRNDRKV